MRNTIFWLVSAVVERRIAKHGNDFELYIEMVSKENRRRRRRKSGMFGIEKRMWGKNDNPQNWYS